MHDILQEPTSTDMLFEPGVGFLLYVMQRASQAIVT